MSSKWKLDKIVRISSQPWKSTQFAWKLNKKGQEFYKELNVISKKLNVLIRIAHNFINAQQKGFKNERYSFLTFDLSVKIKKKCQVF